MSRNKNNERFIPEWYVSDESLNGPDAPTPHEELWHSDGVSPLSLAKAKSLCRFWADEGGYYKTCRIIEQMKDGSYRTVWQSNRVIEIEQQGGSSVSESIKLLIWAHRDSGPPDHWEWRGLFANSIGLDANHWDYVYGRAVDQRGRETRWSIRLNLFHSEGSCADWSWDEILGFEEGKVEVVLSHEIGPREFPAGVETISCVYCGKIVIRSEAWEGEDEEPYCSCRCIDDNLGDDSMRTDPSGYQMEGCEKQNIPTTAA